MSSGFRTLEHPSDIGLEAWGGSPKEAFEQAALGLMSVLVDPGSIEAVQERELQLSAGDPETLLVKFLSEILFLHDAEGFVTAHVAISHMSKTRLVAKLRGEMTQPGKHIVRTDVKAVTYHQLSMRKEGEKWIAVVYFDV